MANKGSPFEREVSVLLSLWWSGGERDDIYWRRDSGARAKTRGRAGKATFGAHGDICAVDPIGLPLTNCCTLELKRGYKQWSFLDILDRPRMKANQKKPTYQKFELFMHQAQEDADLAGTWPVIVAKRDKRCKIIVIPESMYTELVEYYDSYDKFKIRITSNHSINEPMYALDFEHFLEWCSPEFFIIKSQGHNSGKGKSDDKTKKRFRNSK